MSKTQAWEVSDEFWKRVEPLVPQRSQPAGKQYVRKRTLVAPAPFMRAFWSGSAPAFSRHCGKLAWPSMTTCKVLPGVGRASMVLR